VGASRGQQLGVGILMVVATGLFAGMSLWLGAFETIGDRLHVKVVSSDSAGITKGSAVSIAGVEVGTVEAVSLDFNQAVLDLSLDKSAEIRNDVKVYVRSRSVLGEKYLELVPENRDAPLLQEGATLSAPSQVEIDELVQVAGEMVKAVPPEELAQAVRVVIEAVNADPERFKRMLASAENTLANAERFSATLPALEEKVTRTLDISARTLVTIDARARELEPVIDHGDALIADSRAAITHTRELLTQTQAAAEEARRLLADLGPITEDARTVLNNFKDIDKWELRRLLREEGILIRLRQSEVDVPASEK
jgi:phospholipid/cholesterol/gamma-HCH transport system substrate-binding protein